MKADTWIITHAPKFTFSGNASASEDVNWHLQETSTSSSGTESNPTLPYKLPCRQVDVDPSCWQANSHTSCQSAQCSCHADTPFQKQHPLLWAIACGDQLFWTFHQQRTKCKSPFSKHGGSSSSMFLYSVVHYSHINIPDHTYLSFFCKTCFRDPFTMYSVTVANVPPGPSRTTP